MELKPFSYSPAFEQKRQKILTEQTQRNMGNVTFSHPLLLAPMSNICHAPFRYLMQELGSGGTMSELVSCHGILHGNEKTLKMLRVAKKEKSVGIQLFGESPEAMAEAAKVAESYNPDFIDINMGCPVRKVVTKGAGSALLKDLSTLGHYFSTIKKAMNIPLSVKIRTGWDSENLNADEVINIAKDSGIFMVSIHGRTRSQKYMGRANWDYLENTSKDASLPIVGNGDLICPNQIKNKLKQTNCQALMVGRGALRNPFIFLESINTDSSIHFTGEDYLQIILALNYYLEQSFDRERFKLIQLKKFVVWFAAGFSKSARFRSTIFPSKTAEEVLKRSEDYFLSLSIQQNKHIDPNEDFLMSGHG